MGGTARLNAERKTQTADRPPTLQDDGNDNQVGSASTNTAEHDVTRLRKSDDQSGHSLLQEREGSSQAPVGSQSQPPTPNNFREVGQNGRQHPEMVQLRPKDDNKKREGCLENKATGSSKPSRSRVSTNTYVEHSISKISQVEAKQRGELPHQADRHGTEDGSQTDYATGHAPTGPVEGGSPGNEGTRNESQPRRMDFAKWPFPSEYVKDETAKLYTAVKSKNAQNYAGARQYIKMSLNIDNWEKEATGHRDDQMVLQGIKYGFPIQYQGPPQYENKATINHSSAMKFPESIDEYISKEIKYGALEGPFKTPPYTPWFTTSPLMTREKADSQERRVIVDLSFPDGGINAHIQPHIFNGVEATHSPNNGLCHTP